MIDEPRDPSVPLTARPSQGFKADLVMALRFFSRLPTGDTPHEKPDLNRIALALPFASLIMGALPIGLLLLAAWLELPAYFSAALAIGAAILVGGAMSEDALADSADGLFGGQSVARRLEIMKDSRHGSYGVAALCLFIILRVMALGSVVALHPLAAAGLWLGAMVVARSVALILPVIAAPVRPDGAAATVGQLGKRYFSIGLGFALVLGFVLIGPFAGVLGLGLGAIFTAGLVWGWSVLCQNKIGGQTGDLTGALVGLIEIALWCGFLASF